MRPPTRTNRVNVIRLATQQPEIRPAVAQPKIREMPTLTYINALELDAKAPVKLATDGDSGATHTYMRLFCRSYRP